MTRKLVLPRRSLLRGAAGFAMALPALEAMSTPQSKSSPRRYFVGFGGMSTGFYLEHKDLIRPDIVGTGYDTKRGSAPLSERGVTDAVSIVTGLKLPWGNIGQIPGGGRQKKFHYLSAGPLLCGVKGTDDPDVWTPQGPTSDQIAAEALHDHDSHRTLSYRGQAKYYQGAGSGTGGALGRMSYRREDNGTIVPVDATASPRQAYESLFAGFIPDDPAQMAEALTALRRSQSAVDLVLEDANALIPKLGAEDRVRMQRHCDELRDLEMRLNAEIPLGGSCEVPPHPGDDPPLAEPVPNDAQPEDFENGGGYSNEKLRVDILSGLIAIAFACDLSRSASLMYTMINSRMNVKEITGAKASVHSVSHFSAAAAADFGLEAMSDVVAWHVDEWAELVAKLRELPDYDGGTVLDNTALVLVFEGGWGYDPDADRSPAAHSTENMTAFIGGFAGGLNAGGGQHLVAVDQHPTKAMNTALRAVGVNEELGEVSGTFDDLFDG